MKWVKLVLVWLFSILIALVIVQQGWSKFSSDGRWTRSFAEWGYAPWFRVLVGVIETGGGISLLIPPLASYAAIALVAVMVGAFGTLVLDGRVVDAVTPVVYALVLLWIAFERRRTRLKIPIRRAREAT